MRDTRVVGDADLLWGTCCDLLRDQVTDGVWKSTFQGIQPVAVDGDRLVLAVPSGVVADRIHGTYRSLLADALVEAHGEPVELVVEVHPGDPAPAAPGPAVAEAPALALDEVDEPPPLPAAPAPPNGAGPALPGTVDALYTFEDFVIGQSNRFSFAAAQAVAETPGRAYNPLFIYGDAGLGKTHLLQSIRAYVGENYPGKVVRYVSTESFLNDFIESIRLKAQADFKRRYRELDVLLVDDIQFIEGAERFQEEFFHTFNELHARRSQIVLTSDRSPDAIATLEHRLRSRFKMGLITDIQPPDVETRMAILRKKAERAPIPVPDDVLAFIATNITDNIRELEGALTRVSAYANLYQRELGVSLAEQVLSDILGDSQSRTVSPAMILEKVSQRYGFTVEEITGKSRRRPLVTARQVAMYVIRELTDLSYPAIARDFGNRDHTTVMHAVSKIEALMAERKAIFHQVQAIVQELKKGQV
ncbi:chromosomal replication initiator protein DnaA [Iamia majanohamensis]|uniref:Chromosomal replication initiator protein DnaA n=1 Tax=Iamia majanohamensis TaxID=467976 RepID=A0AAE9Y5X9_9ACTN|nr:chromosomal replication initiator protein DnaA [Iamia majanohamensis]WCO67107.1 chromosomal replication initiator protein DnaA [Iamia majanohamensis]